jgi:hypothetical protein
MKIQERGDIGVDDEDDIATATAISAIRTTEWDELLAMDGDATVATLASRGMEHDAIDEGCHCSSLPHSSLNKKIGPAARTRSLENPLWLRSRDDVDDFAATCVTEFDSSCCESEERVILTDTDILSWVELGATLTDEDLAAVDYLTTESLDPEILRVGIATVTCRGDTLFTCHLLFASPSTSHR